MHAEVGVDQGGFRELLGTITLPAATIAVDAGHHIIGSTGPNGSVIWATDTSPQLYGNSGAAYSTALHGWLPVSPDLVAPDGLHYAYEHVDGTLRLADSTGQEVIVSNPQNLAPIAYTAAGVVLVKNANAANGLWMLDVASHVITQLVAPAGNDDWLEVNGATAWGMDSPGALGAPKPTEVLKASLTKGSTAAVAFSAPAGDSIATLAADRSGGVVVVLLGASPSVQYIDPSGAAGSAAAPSVVAVMSKGIPRHSADAHGVWFLGYAGVFLFTPGAGLQSVGPALKQDVVPAGDCV